MEVPWPWLKILISREEKELQRCNSKWNIPESHCWEWCLTGSLSPKQLHRKNNQLKNHMNRDLTMWAKFNFILWLQSTKAFSEHSLKVLRDLCFCPVFVLSSVLNWSCQSLSRRKTDNKVSSQLYFKLLHNSWGYHVLPSLTVITIKTVL